MFVDLNDPVVKSVMGKSNDSKAQELAVNHLYLHYSSEYEIKPTLFSSDNINLIPNLDKKKIEMKNIL